MLTQRETGVKVAPGAGDAKIETVLIILANHIFL
jgi:hypothetical protein